MDAFELAKSVVQMLNDKDLDGEDVRLAIASKNPSSLAHALERAQGELCARTSELLIVGSAAADLSRDETENPLVRLANITQLLRDRIGELFALQRAVDEACMECLKARANSWRIQQIASGLKGALDNDRR